MPFLNQLKGENDVKKIIINGSYVAELAFKFVILGSAAMRVIKNTVFTVNDQKF